MDKDDPIREFLKRKETNYRLLFRAQDKKLNQAAKIVLSDLRVFCHGTQSAFDKDPIEMARKAGRQEVFQRIMNFLEVDYSEYYQLVEEIE